MQNRRKISEHALQTIEGVLSEAGRYDNLPDRNFYLMIVSSTLIKAIYNLSGKEVGHAKASEWVKQHLETLGPFLSQDAAPKVEIQVTIE